MSTVDPLWKSYWPACRARLEQRMEQGYVEYGDGSFERPVSDLLAEVEEEILDQINWSFIAWTKVKKLQDRVRDSIGHDFETLATKTVEDSQEIMDALAEKSDG